MNVLLMDPWAPFPGDLNMWQDGDVSLNDRYYYVWDDVRRNLGYARNLSLCFDMNDLVPDLHFCSSGYCLASPNKQYICYFPAGGYEGIDLRGMDGEFFIEWLDPKSGITRKGGSIHIQNVRQTELCAPFEGPSVLLLFKERKYLSPKRAIFR